MNTSERIKIIRKDLGMTRAVFGDTLGVSGDVINNMERGRVKLQEHMLRLICKTHNVSYLWLVNGIGEPYIGIPGIIMDGVIEKYNLDDIDKKIIEEYVRLDPETRSAIKNYLQNVFKTTSD